MNSWRSCRNRTPPAWRHRNGLGCSKRRKLWKRGFRQPRNKCPRRSLSTSRSRRIIAISWPSRRGNSTWRGRPSNGPVVPGRSVIESQKEIEALKGEIQAAEARLADLAWGDEEEAKLAEARQQREQYRRLEAEITLIRGQHNERAAQIGNVQKMQKRFLVQASHVANMGAVSDFLSYDNGPQKFLTGIFQETLNQTNVLLSEMGLPVKLHMGDELEVLVQDRNSPESPASELGGGYANLIGLAFRIALQKTILPRVHVIVLDEPSTHVDQANMELLIPFFDRLKENLSSYGIDQLILIDHHPDWSQSNAGLIPIGNRTESCLALLEIHSPETNANGLAAYSLIGILVLDDALEATRASQSGMGFALMAEGPAPWPSAALRQHVKRLRFRPASPRGVKG